VGVDELQSHAQDHIDERPAWPKAIHVIDAIPLTTVGKIYKPSLRCEAARLMITDVVHDKLNLTGYEVDVTDGGARGMRVTVTLEEDNPEHVSLLEEELSAYLFEAVVQSG
ncbi:MAG: acyl-CoA synthetase, partial [Pseudomonadota bacterium]